MTTDLSQKRLPIWVHFVTAILLAVACAYLFRGFRILLHKPAPDLNMLAPSDLMQRWREVRTFVSRDNPYQIDRQPSPYPPASLLSLVPIVWPARLVIQPYFAAWNAVAIVVMTVWAAGRSGDRAGKWLLAACVLALSGTCTTLGVGQIGVVVTGMLVAVLITAERRWPVIAGLLFGVALLKPTTAGLFVFPLLLRRRYTTVVTATAYYAVVSIIALLWVRIWPTELLEVWKTMADNGGLNQGTGGLIDLIRSTGLDTRRAMTVVGAVATISTLATLWFYRRRDLTTLFAVAAVGGRLWSYHSGYDNVMLVFLLIALGSSAIRRRHALTTAAFFFVGLTLWVPAKMTEPAAVQLVQVFIWIGGLGVLLGRSNDPEPAETIATTAAGFPNPE